MSVSITIRNNSKFCDKHGLTHVDQEQCLCTQGGEAEPSCAYCRGSGVETVRSYPFELNVSNVNFVALWRALGLVVVENDLCGSLDARTIMAAMERSDMSTMQRPYIYQTGINENGEKVHAEHRDYGIDADRVQSYRTRLAAICQEAERREEEIVWC
ncbi:MAG: hypothetical protein NXI32_04855 [bacterium]|nr:hypothetical protein [bacterium]